MLIFGNGRGSDRNDSAAIAAELLVGAERLSAVLTKVCHIRFVDLF